MCVCMNVHLKIWNHPSCHQQQRTLSRVQQAVKATCECRMPVVGDNCFGRTCQNKQRANRIQKPSTFDLPSDSLCQPENKGARRAQRSSEQRGGLGFHGQEKMPFPSALFAVLNDGQITGQPDIQREDFCWDSYQDEIR